MAHTKEKCGCEYAGSPGDIGVCFALGPPASDFPDGWVIPEGSYGWMFKPCAKHVHKHDEEKHEAR